VDIVASRPGKHGRSALRAVLIGVAFIGCGALLELACLPIATIAERVEHHRARLAELERVRADLDGRATAALTLSASIDETWVHYDLDVQQLELAFDAETSAGTPKLTLATRRRIVAQLARISPLAALGSIGRGPEPDPTLLASRAAFLTVYREFTTRLAAFADLLGNGVDVSAPAALEATRTLRTLEADVDRRWAAISIAARTRSDDETRAAEDAERAVDDERAKNVLAVIATP